MKIGILCYPTFGGSGIVATELGMLLAEHGYEVHFISNKMPARLDMTRANIFFHKVVVEQYPLFHYQPFGIALASTIMQVVTRHGLDVIHAHYAIPYAYAAYFAKQTLRDEGVEIPVVTTLHGTDITLVGQHPSYKKVVEFSINHSDFVTSVSQSLKQDTLKGFHIKKNIEVIPNFIDNSKFSGQNQCCREQFASEEEKILIHVSNMRPVKRIGDVLEVFRKTNLQTPCKLILVGEGPEMETINRFLTKYPELVAKIRLMGQVTDIYPILHFADIFLLPSQQESFGLAALEAMAVKTAVIGSDAGGIPEVNIHGSTGYISKVGDVDDMVKNTVKLCQDPALLKTMKENAQKRAHDFDIQKILPLYQYLYQRAIDFSKNTNS